MLTEEELLAKANKPAEDAMRLHPFYRGKVQTALKCVVRGLDDFGSGLRVHQQGQHGRHCL